MVNMWKSVLKNLSKNMWNDGGINVENFSGKVENSVGMVDKNGFTQSYSTKFHIVLNRDFTPVKIVSFPLFTHSLILQLLII